MPNRIIKVPQLICSRGRAEQGVERILKKILDGRAERTVLDFGLINFLRPYPVLMLAYGCRYLSQLVGDQIEIVNIQEDVHAYLERAKFFDIGEDWLFTLQRLPDQARLSENRRSDRILPMTFIRTDSDLNQIIRAADTIFSTWLYFPQTVLDDLISVIIELCKNVKQHSGDPVGGMIMIQSYRYQDHFEVVLAVADMGDGVPRTLEPLYKDKAATAAGFIKLALEGASSKGEGNGGDGLPTVCDIAGSYGGSVLLRSQNGRVKVEDNTKRIFSRLCCFKGTQLQVELRSR